MPKLIYFDVQGRAQAIRFLLQSKGVEFEDQRITREEWGAIKAAGTYGESQTPIYVTDDGKYYAQSAAILKMLAKEHGYGSETPAQEYEQEWYYATVVDCLEGQDKKMTLFTFVNPGAT